MPYQLLLARIRQILADSESTHFESIAHGFRVGQLNAPAHPMTDQELARAIREFQSAPVSEWTLRKLSNRFEGL